MTDTFKTIANPSPEILFKEKNSKFFGYAFPVEKEDDVKSCLEILKKQHPSARHFCYAYQMGSEEKHYRVNDDGEPNNAAGMPIYGQILSFEVTNVLIVIIRYFGGTKLGVGGLISAYKTVAQMSLENSEIVEETIDVEFKISFDYKNMNKVMRVIKEKNLEMISHKMNESCEIIISDRKKNAEMIFAIFDNLFEVSVFQL